MIIIEATIKRPDSRGGDYIYDVERKVFKDDDTESVQNFLNKDFCYPYSKNECSVNFNYLKL